MMSDQEQKALGVFYTEAELRAVPSRRYQATSTPTSRRDPTDAPPSKDAAALAASPGVCAWCGEPPDDRSGLGTDALHDECRATQADERNAR
jgi:hypothetical protein